MRACGWYVLDVFDGSYDVQAIVSALNFSRTVKDKPIFINIRTVIGLGTPAAGTAKAHHGVFDEKTVANSKRQAGQDPNTTHQVPGRALQYFRVCKTVGLQLNANWDDLVERYHQVYPELHEVLQQRQRGELGEGLERVFESIDTSDMSSLATRESNGMIMEKLWASCSALCGGGADLSNSNKIYQALSDVFLPGNYGGRYIRYGIREHAMASISNGIAAYGPGTFVPVTATFLMFYLYVSYPQFICKCANTMLTAIRLLLVSGWVL
jgi:dihydroxyacetone synthase